VHPALYNGNCDYGWQNAKNEKIELLKYRDFDWVKLLMAEDYI